MARNWVLHYPSQLILRCKANPPGSALTYRWGSVVFGKTIGRERPITQRGGKAHDGLVSPAAPKTWAKLANKIRRGCHLRRSAATRVAGDQRWPLVSFGSAVSRVPQPRPLSGALCFARRIRHLAVSLPGARVTAPQETPVTRRSRILPRGRFPSVLGMSSKLGGGNHPST